MKLRTYSGVDALFSWTTIHCDKCNRALTRSEAPRLAGDSTGRATCKNIGRLDDAARLAGWSAHVCPACQRTEIQGGLL